MKYIVYDGWNCIYMTNILIYLEYLDYGHNIMILYFFQQQPLFIIGQFILMHAIYSCYFDSMTWHNKQEWSNLLNSLSETKLFRILRGWMNSRLLHYVLLFAFVFGLWPTNRVQYWMWNLYSEHALIWLYLTIANLKM